MLALSKYSVQYPVILTVRKYPAISLTRRVLKVGDRGKLDLIFVLNY